MEENEKKEQIKRVRLVEVAEVMLESENENFFEYWYGHIFIGRLSQKLDQTPDKNEEEFSNKPI